MIADGSGFRLFRFFSSAPPPHDGIGEHSHSMSGVPAHYTLAAAASILPNLQNIGLTEDM